MLRVKSDRHRIISEAAPVLSPILGLVLVFIWFSIHTIPEGENINASLANPIGFLISNFVYDGLTNIENIVLSCAFLLAIFLFCPTFLRIRSAIFLPAIAVTSGAIAELAAAVTCGNACSFYGMSGVAGGIIGFTFANFSIILELMFSTRHEKKVHNNFTKDKLPRFSVPVLLVAYILLLFLVSGFFAIHPTSTNNPFPITIQVPVSIAGESQSVQVGHFTGLAFGFSLCLALLLYYVKRRPHPQNVSQGSLSLL